MQVFCRCKSEREGGTPETLLTLAPHEVGAFCFPSIGFGGYEAFYFSITLCFQRFQTIEV